MESSSDEDIDRLIVARKPSIPDNDLNTDASSDSQESEDESANLLPEKTPPDAPLMDSQSEQIRPESLEVESKDADVVSVPKSDESPIVNNLDRQTPVKTIEPMPQAETTTKWADWLQITSDQLSKNIKDRGAIALDALSTLTSSGTIRKRKKRVTNPTADDDLTKQTGVGILHVELVSAYKSFAKDAADGDHFVVVNLCTCGSLATSEPLIDTNQERETQIIESSATPVFNEKYEFVVPNFRTALKLTLVDAISEKKVGISIIHLYALIQRDADKYKGKWDAAEIENIPMKDLSGKNLIGHFSARIRFQEDIQGLFLSSDPRKAPSGPPEAMSLERVQVHVRRFGKFIEVLTKLFRRYRSLMDWENPPFTFAIFGSLVRHFSLMRTVLFVYFTLYLDAEYALCAPLFILVALLTETWFHREFGYFKKKWVVAEDDSMNYPYRPVSYLRLAVAGFRNFGLKGVPKTPPPFVRITLLPDGDNSGKLGANPQTEYHIATFSTSMDRQGGFMLREPIDASRQKQSSGIGQFISSLSLSKNDGVLKDALLQNVSDPWIRQDSASGEHVDISYLYPILQKFSEMPVDQTAADDKQKTKKKKSHFIPWSKSTAVIKFSFHGDNPLSTFLDNAWGSVQIPISDLVGEELKNDETEEIPGVQEEVRVWKDIVWTSAHLQRLRTMQEEEDLYVENIGDLDNPYAMFAPQERRKVKSALKSQVNLSRIRQNSLKDPLPEDLEISRVVQSIIMPKNEKSQTAISAIWNARDHIKYVQNIMGGVIDKLESFKNIFNWTVPSKTFPLYALLVATWLATVYIPGRYLILLVGLSEFFFIFMPQPEELPLTIKVMNLITSLPNDDDLFEIYRAERESNGAAFEEKQKERLKQVKLRLVLDCRWDGAVKIKQPGTPSIWMDAFLVIQGHRLVWWATENDVHEGNAPVGEILLQGHAGTTHASPVDIREVGNDLRLVVVFGRDAHGGQIKRTILCSDAESCDSLKSIVNSLLNDVQHLGRGQGGNGI